MTLRATDPPERRMPEILRRLDARWPDAWCALKYSNPLELFVATVLSAQCTDERVNQVTREVFQKYRTAEDYARAPREALEEAFRPTGYFRQKARTIQEACRVFVEKYGGQVPRDMDALTQLRGIGRKTANVILGTAFGIPTGIVVDTHVRRVSQRLGLTKEKDPDKIEQDLMRLVPREKWIKFGHQMIWHGRYICKARKPLCGECPLRDLCPSAAD